MPATVSIENLAQFRRDLRAAEDATPRELTKALKVAGVAVAARAGSLSPRRTGTLAAGYKASVTGTTGRIVSAVPYAGGAEWGRFGKWKGFNRYGAAGSRFAGKAIEDMADDIVTIITRELQDIVDMHGWAR